MRSSTADFAKELRLEVKPISGLCRYDVVWGFKRVVGPCRLTVTTNDWLRTIRD